MLSNTQMQRGCALRIAVGITMITLLLAGSTSAATITVPTDYAKIQWAIDNATSGDTIEVHPGIYFENVNVTRQLTLRGIGMPVVDARGIGSAITLAADGIILEGFTATGADSNGIYVSSSSNNNTLRDNNASNNSFEGIYLVTTRGNTLVDNNVSDGWGIGLVYSDINTLSGNNVRNGSIVIHKSSSNTLRGNNVSKGIIRLSQGFSNILSGNHVSYGGILLGDSRNNILSSNNVSNNSVGIELDFFSSNNTIIGNTISNNSESGINPTRGSGGNIIYNNYLNNNINFNFYFLDIPINSTENTWNTTKMPGSNIIGGSYLGGNFWADSNGTGFSQTCADANIDGICDSPYVLDANNVDYLPLTLNLPITPALTPTPSPAPIATPTPNSTLTPEVASWDANHDDIIQKSEAITAVVNYFSGGITKANAFEVVREYFGA